MTLHETLKNSIPDALRERSEVRLRTLRSLVAAMTNEVIAKKRQPEEFLTDEEAFVVLKRAANQRVDSIQQFEKASRKDLVEPEMAELAIIESYLPAMMSTEEITTLAKAKMQALGVSTKADANSPRLSSGEAGRLIGALMKDLKGKADGGDVKAVVDGLLSTV